MTSWLDALHAFSPMHGVLYVGAGAGTDAITHWLLKSRAHVCLVEADPIKSAYLKRLNTSRSSWEIRSEMITPSEEVLAFHHHNLPDESGLLNAVQLKPLWPTITAADPIQSNNPATTITLGKLLTNQKQPINWLLIDCLPAASLLEEANDFLSTVDVLLARVVTQDALGVAEARLSTLEPQLTNLGFRCVHHEPERHPAIATAFFVRDYQKQLKVAEVETAKQVAANEALTEKHSATVAQEIDKLQQENRAQMQKIAAEHQQKLDLLQGEVADLKSNKSLLTHELTLAENQLSLLHDLIQSTREI